MTEHITIYAEPEVTGTGKWCDKCLLPSVVELTIKWLMPTGISECEATYCDGCAQPE